MRASMLLLAIAGCSIQAVDYVPAIDAPETDAPETADAPIDALVCTLPDTSCGAVCVDIADDPAHCGRCGHDCGGGTCSRGVCQAITLVDGRTGPIDLAVNGSAMFWSEPTRVMSCPLPGGCTLAPTVVADAYARTGPIGATAERVYWAGCRGDSCDDRHRIFECPVAGCPPFATAVASTTSSFLELALGATHGYFRADGYGVHACGLDSCATTDVLVFDIDTSGLAIDGGTAYARTLDGIESCPEASDCATSTLIAKTGAISSPFRVHAGKAYWFGTAGPGIARYNTCAIADCTETTFGSDLNGISELEVDDSGVYWLNASAGTLRWCPLAGCTGAPTYVAEGLVAPHALALDDRFVYWIEGGALRKVARP